MFSTVSTAALLGLEVKFVQVEADVSSGLPGLHLVGYLSSEVKEAAERVRAAMKNSGFPVPVKKVLVNLSPADLRKRGTAYDLPAAVSVLLASRQITPGEELMGNSRLKEKVLWLGELGLDGRVRGVPGVLPVVMEAQKRGYEICVVPRENEPEAALVEGIQILGVADLKEAADFIACPERKRRGEFRQKDSPETTFQPDFSEVRGQRAALRAAELAVAGGHNLLLIGPPGSGKTMLAKRIPGILPGMTRKEQVELTKLYSAAGLLKKEEPLIRRRPFREVHHTVSRPALLGGGLYPLPGEISLASGGVLFLDELAEFPRAVLETLRQPLEEKEVRLVRSTGVFVYPADGILVAAMNPCPCGNYPDRDRCRCTESQIRNYLGRLSHPFIDRLDLCVEVPRVDYEDLKQEEKGESSQEIRARVEEARQRQARRYKGLPFQTNANIPPAMIRRFCPLGKEQEGLMKKAFAGLSLSARGYHRILKTARTAADLEGQEEIRPRDLLEALGYRMPDQKYWGGGHGAI